LGGPTARRHAENVFVERRVATRASAPQHGANVIRLAVAKDGSDQEETSMARAKTVWGIAGALCAYFFAVSAHAAPNKVVIGDIDDMSGVYADVIGAGGVEAAKMAIADFGGSVLGQPIELLTADHQNKPDIGVQKFREWADQSGLTMLLGGSNTGVSLAINAAVKEKKIPFIAIGAAGASLTGKDCTPYTVHYAYDTTALANGTAKTILNQGGKSWFFLTADYAFGTQLQNAASDVVKAGGGTVVGAVRIPLGTSDFASYLLQAQSSGAQVLGLANAGNDTSNSLKAATEFGLTKTMKPAALLAFITDIHAIGLEAAQGLYLTAGWYWDLNDKSRAFGKRFLDKVGRAPTFSQAAYYSATLTYLNAVKAAGTTDSDKVMAELHKTKIDDMFTSNGVIRPDGLMEHDMYIMQVKTPAESKAPWDYYKLVQTMKGEEAFGPLDKSTCPLLKQ
jgi:branched-chain amino acid transport system substrate-binding protein